MESRPLFLIIGLVAIASAFPSSGGVATRDDDTVTGQFLNYSPEEHDDFLGVPGTNSAPHASAQNLVPGMERALTGEPKLSLPNIQFNDDPLGEAQTMVSGRAQDFEKAFKQLGYFETNEQEAEKQDEEVLEASDPQPDDVVEEVWHQSDIAPAKSPVTDEIQEGDVYTPSEPISEGMTGGGDTEEVVATEANIAAPGTDTAEAEAAGAAQVPTAAPTAAAAAAAASSATTEASSAASATTAAASDTASESAATASPTEAASAEVNAEGSAEKESAAGHNHHVSIMTVAAALLAVAMVNKF